MLACWGSFDVFISSVLYARYFDENFLENNDSIYKITLYSIFIRFVLVALRIDSHEILKCVCVCTLLCKNHSD